MRRFVYFLVVWSLGAVVTAPGCNVFQDIGNAECSIANQGEGGDDGAGGDGAGGDVAAAGGAPGAGTGGATSASATVGAGGAPGAGAGAGADPGSGVGAGDPGARHAPGRPRHVRRHRRGAGIGTAAQADCPAPAGGTLACGTAGEAPLGDIYVYCDAACMTECSPMMGTFDSSIFKFVTTIPDDGTDKGGGWQQASNELKFRRWTGLLPESWTCPQITVGMPLRTTATPAITPAYAASITAGIANTATGVLMHPPSGIDPPPGVFCTQLKPTMQQLFDTVYGAKIGAKLSTP
jgi:hypothetical protein